MKKFFADYFNFSKKETIATLCLTVVCAVCIVLPMLLSNKTVATTLTAQQQATLATTILVDSVADDNAIYNNYSSTNNYSYHKKEKEVYTLHPFTFNPNTLSQEGWQKIGLPPKTIATIINYTNKGGYFKTAEDIRKIWGLKKEDADVLIPYIVIPNNVTTTNNKYNNKPVTATIASVDINTATAIDFKQLPLVGNIAYKIVKYREKLGGFLSINQIKETYGMNDTIYDAIKPYLQLINTQIHPLNINTASDYELGGHPYISKDIAKAIVIYRTQHGAYKAVSDIKKIVFLHKDVIDKISPYLTVE